MTDNDKVLDLMPLCTKSSKSYQRQACTKKKLSMFNY